MKIKGVALSRFAQKMRIPPGIVHIAFPVLCWTLVISRWCGVWFTEPCMSGVIVFYYVLAAAYLFFTFIKGMRVIAIIGFFLMLAAFLFVWIPYNWVLAILMVPAAFRAFHDGDSKAFETVMTVLLGISVLFVIGVSKLFGGLNPEKYEYHMSPDSRYVALEYAFKMMPGGTDIMLCRACGPLLIKERVLYLANYSGFGGKIEWLDGSTIVIYGEKMDVFKDPPIERYDYF